MSNLAEYQSLDGVPVPMLVVHGERMVHANPALLSLLGVQPREVDGASTRELMTRFSPADQGWLEPLHLEFNRGVATPTTLWIRVRDAGGQERTYCLLRGQGVRAGDTLLVLLDSEGEASMRHLTESLVETASELMHCRDEESVLQTAVESIHRQGFFVAVLRLDGEALVHGPMRQDPLQVAAAERLYGEPIQTRRFPRDSVPFVEEVLRTNKALFHQDLLRALEGFHAPELLEQMRRAHPIMRSLEAPIFVEGAPYGILSVQGESLTPTSAATLELFARQVGGALENVRHHMRAAARLAELSKLQAELVARERLLVLGEAAGVVAHEVRNPLGAILNAVAVLKRDRLSALGSSAMEMLEEEARRLDVMVRDLLDVVRPLEPRPRLLHPGELARQTLEVLRGRRQLGTARVSVDEDPSLPLLFADELLLQLALENLLRNAVQASPPGGQVRLRVARVPEGLCFTVEDEGPGVTPADAQRIFEPFFTTRATGTGLGLAVVRRVVTVHGGTVSVSQRPGGGARFELRLPLQVETRSPPETPER